jgi:hypothetical protein
MAEYNAGFSNRPYRLRLVVDLAWRNVGTGQYSVNWSLWIHQDSASDHWYLNNDRPWFVSIDGQNFSGTYSYDFRGGVNDIQIAWGSKTGGIGSYRDIGVHASATSASLMGSAAVWGSYGIAWVPGAPNPVALDEVTPVSMRYRFSGTTDNGSGILEWQAQIDDASNFSSPVTVGWSTGTTAFTGLTPATTYYARSRGRNAVGWGPWSSTISKMTASGAYVSINGSWVPVPAYVSNGSSWLTPELQISDGSTWERAA